MKYWFVYLIFATCTIHAQNIELDTFPYALEYHNQRLSNFEKEPIFKNRIVFLGNSLIEFGNWRTLLHDSTIINRGIAGDITYGLLDRIDNIIMLQPAKLFIEIGINDIAKNIPTTTIAENINTIITKIKQRSPSTIIYVHSILPTNNKVKKHYPDAYNKNNRVVDLNALLKANATDLTYTYIDTYNIVKNKKGLLNKLYAAKDGLHLNQKGYEAWINYLKTKKYL